MDAQVAVPALRVSDGTARVTKKIWLVSVPGYAPFTMVLMDEPMDESKQPCTRESSGRAQPASEKVMTKDQNVNDVIQSALNQIMLTMKPVNTQESGELLCYAMTKMVEILAVIGGREQAQLVLTEMSKHVAGCKLPKVQMVGTKSSTSAPGNTTVN